MSKPIFKLVDEPAGEQPDGQDAQGARLRRPGPVEEPRRVRAHDQGASPARPTRP